MKNLYTLFFMIALLCLNAQTTKHFNSNSHRNCGTMELHEEQMRTNPQYRLNYLNTFNQINQRAEEIKAQRSQSPNNRLNGNVITVPVVYHVIHNGEAIGTQPNLSEALLLAQIEQLNLDYRALNSDVGNTPAEFEGLVGDLEVEFCLAVRDPDGNETTGINRYNYNQSSYSDTDFENTIKPATIWDRDSYLNVWTGNLGGGLLGYAQFPNGAANTDGVVLLASSVGSVATPNPSGGNYALGRTATHEVGHWLSLYHIWGDDLGSCTGSDQVADTPNQGDSYGGSPNYPQTSCNSSDMFMNYMDYVNDSAMYMFTLGQKDRTDATLSVARASLQNSMGCVPVDGFNLTATNTTQNICVGSDATYTIDVNFIGAYIGTVNLSQTGLPAGVSTSFSPSTINAQGTTTLTISNTSSLTNGSYNFTITGDDGTMQSSINLILEVKGIITTAPTLLSPADGVTSASVNTNLNWSADPNAAEYFVEIATNANFTSIVETQTVTTNTATTTSLLTETTYYWRVTAQNQCSSLVSSVFKFITPLEENCSNYITDGSFEASITPNVNWTEYSSNDFTLIYSSNPNTGSNAALLGGETNDTSVIWQNVSIPAEAALVKLRYFYKITSSERNCGDDVGGFTIVDESAGVYTTGILDYNLCTTTVTNGYIEECIDLSSYKGQTVGIGFYTENDRNAASSLYIDDVELIICNDASWNIPTDTNEYIADYEVTTIDGWTHYLDDNGTPCDYLDDWRLLSVQKNGENIGSIGDTGFEVKLNSNPTSTAISAPFNNNSTEYYSMNRYWELTPVNEPSTPLNTKHYYADNDYAAIETMANGKLTAHEQLYNWKINDNTTAWDSNPINEQTNVVAAPSNNGDGLWSFSEGATSVDEYTYQKFPGAVSGPYHSAEFMISYYKGGGGIAYQFIPCTTAPNLTGTISTSNIGISTLNRGNTDWVANENNAFIKIESETLGFVLTRMNSSNRDALNAEEGMVIWNTDTQTIQYFNGTTWISAVNKCKS